MFLKSAAPVGKHEYCFKNMNFTKFMFFVNAINNEKHEFHKIHGKFMFFEKCRTFWKT